MTSIQLPTFKAIAEDGLNPEERLDLTNKIASLKGVASVAFNWNSGEIVVTHLFEKERIVAETKKLPGIKAAG